MKSDLKFTVIVSLFWKLMERGVIQGVQFIIQIVLARLLLPEDYGLVGLLTVFIVFANVFIQSGFSIALIQKKDATETDFSSVFHISLLISILLYLTLFFTAPLISSFYGETQLVPMLRVLAVTLFIGVFNSIQNAYLARKMLFKMLFFSSLGGIFISGIIGIVMAYCGFGVWALIAQQLTNQLLITIILWFTVKWRPKILFSFKSVKGLFSFGWKLLVSALVDTTYMNINNLIIGKMFSPEVLGFYSRGQQFPSLIVSNINGSIQSVMLPALSAEQENKIRVKNMVRRSIVTSSFIVFPMMFGLAVIAEPLIVILLTEKWLSAVPFLQIFCFSYALWPLHTANLQAINALGRSDIFLKLEIIKIIVGLSILGVTFSHGVYAIALGTLFSGIVSSFINSCPNKKLLNYGFKEQWKDIGPSLMLSLLMGLIIYFIQFIGFNAWITMVIQVLFGIGFYIISARILNFECFNYLLITINDFLRVKKEEIE